MSYRFVKAIAMGTVGLSTGMVRFEPENEDERYHGGVFNPVDAKRLVDKEIGEDVGPATEEDFEEYISLFSSGAPDPGRRLAEVMRNQKELAEQRAAEGEEVEVPELSPAAVSAVLQNASDEAPIQKGTEELGVRELRTVLRETNDPAQLAQMLASEQSGANRPSAIKYIEQRIRGLSGVAPDANAEEAPVEQTGAGAGSGTEPEPQTQEEQPAATATETQPATVDTQPAATEPVVQEQADQGAVTEPAAVDNAGEASAETTEAVEGAPSTEAAPEAATTTAQPAAAPEGEDADGAAEGEALATGISPDDADAAPAG